MPRVNSQLMGYQRMDVIHGGFEEAWMAHDEPHSFKFPTSS